MSVRPDAGHRRAPALTAVLAVLVVAFGWLAPQTAHAADLPDGSTVWIGSGSPGPGIVHPVYLETPADPGNPGVPDLWAYCIENKVSAETHRLGTVGDWASFPGENHFLDAGIAAKVSWVVANSYPAVSLEQMRINIGFPGLTEFGAAEGTQYAVWRYTELDFDAPWDWKDGTGSEEIYWYLVNGANAASAPGEDQVQTSVSLTGPAAPQQAPSLIGPFVVSTDQPTASVTVDPTFVITDSSGAPVDPNAVVDGQELYVDARSTDTAGSVTMTASVAGSAATGKVVTVPSSKAGQDHAQSMILIAGAGTTNDASATVAYAAAAVPLIGTSVSVEGAADKVLPLSGGTVTDTVSFEGLVPGASHQLAGEVRTAPGGVATGITATTTFTPAAASGTTTVTFVITADQVAAYAGQNLVVFEYLTLDGAPVAEHTDVNDGAQTFTVAAAPIETTTTSTTTAASVPVSTAPPSVPVPTAPAAGPVVPNVPVDQLPETGGSPTGLLIAAATLLLAGGAVVTLTRRKRPA